MKTEPRSTPEQPGEIDVLVVEAEPALRRHIVDLLTSDGYRVGEAEDGFDALQQIKSMRIGAVVLDPALPVLNGYALLEKLAGTACPPIVMMRSDDDGGRVPWTRGSDRPPTRSIEPSELSLLMATALNAGGWLRLARQPSRASDPGFVGLDADE